MSSLADRTQSLPPPDGLRARLGAAFSAIPRPLRGDYVMAVNRFIAGCLMLLAACLLGGQLPLRQWALPILVWTACGLLLLVQLQLMPQAAATRRSLAIVLDVSGASIMIAAGGEATAFVYVVYLWIIIGNGFRFGARYIFAASLACIAGFGTVIAVTPFWHDHHGLSFGLLSGIIVLPAYSFALIRQVAEAKRQAERADQAKSLFLASVSHELRTPLNAIIGTAELLAETALDADQAEMVATINSAADGQLSLVRDVLEFSRIDAGHGRVEAKAFQLADLFSVVRAIVAVEARRKGLLINSYITARTPLSLIGDERHLREILLNLCDNAIKFTQSGSVTIAADGSPSGDGQVRLRLEVADTGIGIATEATEHIFGLFTQADAAVMESFGGTGLGLALCERQVRLMGGRIGVDSALNFGSTFWVSVDLQRAPDPPAELPHVTLVAVPAGSSAAASVVHRLAGQPGGAMDEAAAASTIRSCIAIVEEGSSVLPRAGAGAAIEVVPGPITGLPGRWTRERFSTSVSQDSGTDELRQAIRIASAFSLKGRFGTPGGAAPSQPHARARLLGLRVLVADDNAINRTIVSRMLEGAGMIAVAAHNGEEALSMMSEGGVDAALLDVNMPVMDGAEAAEFYRIAVPGGSGMPLIALTADATPQTRTRCLKAGMAACLVKPVRTADLLDALDHALAARPALTDVAPTTPDAVQTLDSQTLADLHGLGGESFVALLVAEFARDGAAVLEQLAAACMDRDVQAFRTLAHSLCSIAANVGASALRDLCVPWQDIAEPVLQRDAPALLASVRQEWNRTQRELQRHLTALEQR